MTAAVIIQGFVIVALVAALLVRERDHDRCAVAREGAWAMERSELLERIQRPEIVPARQRRAPANLKPVEATELHRVGVVEPFRAEQVTPGE